MSDQEVAYCGLVCGACPGRQECVGCHAGGGEANCKPRLCGSARGLNGCWECAEFPCEQDFLQNEDFGGLCTGFIRVAQKLGPEALARRVIARFGSPMDFEAHRGRQADDVMALLLDDEQQP
ncbi:MAG: DUF3795 domain-containing protein [Chloroflexi bacterium]|jgi:hypothetical protein|nr:DUF3795 domain-containing protein [Chloroflexota bacterium]